MNASMQFLTDESTILGITFQNWMVVIAGTLIVWIAVLASRLWRA